jgi:hypothetical protein
MDKEMTKNEIVQRNISLAFDFIRHLTKNPDLLKSIPDHAEVQFVTPDLPVAVAPESVREPRRAVLYRVDHTFSEIAELKKPE